MSLGYKDLWEAEIRYPEFGFDFLATFPVKRHLRDQRYSAPFSVQYLAKNQYGLCYPGRGFGNQNPKSRIRFWCFSYLSIQTPHMGTTLLNCIQCLVFNKKLIWTAKSGFREIKFQISNSVFRFLAPFPDKQRRRDLRYSAILSAKYLSKNQFECHLS